MKLQHFWGGLIAGLVVSSVTAYAGTAGSVSLQSAAYTVDQSGGNLCFAVTRSGGSSGSISVHYATSVGTAVAGTDYTSTSGSLSWSDGDMTTVNTITVPWNNVTPYSGTKTFTVTLSSPTNGAALGSYPSTLVTVSNDLIAPATFIPNWSAWKLTIPVGIYGGTGGTNGSQFGAATITSAQLTAGFADPYFYMNNGQIIFTTPSNGATTSPGVGSNHTRSELRELYSGPEADSNNDWYASTGGSLSAAVQILQVSAESDEITIGQIHGQSSAFVLLVYRPAKNDIELALYQTPTSATGSSTAIIPSGVSLGTVINYTITLKGSQLSISVNGNNLFVPIDCSWLGQGLYFKLGAYHAAPNTGNPAGDQSQLAVSAFSVSHNF